VGRVLKILALIIGLTALAVLLFFGFAIWVFIPLLPAGIIYLIAVAAANRTAALRPKASERDRRKAA